MVKVEDYEKTIIQEVQLNVVQEVVEHNTEGTPIASSRLYQIKEVSTQDIFECPECNEKFKTKYSYRIHKNIHGDKYKCTICDVPHVKKERLLAHLKREHTDDEQRKHHQSVAKQKQEYIKILPIPGEVITQQQVKSSKVYNQSTFCLTCEIEFINTEEYFKHVRDIHHTNDYICSICNKVLKSRKTFKHHMVRAHSDKTNTSTMNLCSFCNAKYLLQRDLKNHIRVKHMQQPSTLSCPECYEAFTSRRDLNQHKQTHKNEDQRRPHQCKLCYKTFTRFSTLRDHSVTHSQERNFTCHVCHQSYPRKSYLRIHMRIHTGERPYVCDRPNCDTRFYDPASFRQHRIMHEKKENAVSGCTSIAIIEEADLYYFE